MLVGILCDRFGHKRLGLAGLAVMAAGGLLGAAAQGYPALLVSRFLEGAGFIFFAVTGAALINASVASPARPQPRARPVDRLHAGRRGACDARRAGRHGDGRLARFWMGLSVAALGHVQRWSGAWCRRHTGQRRFTLRLAMESLAQPGSVALALLFPLLRVAMDLGDGLAAHLRHR